MSKVKHFLFQTGIGDALACGKEMGYNTSQNTDPKKTTCKACLKSMPKYIRPIKWRKK